MIFRNLRLATRIFLKYKLNSIITVLGLSTGLGCFLTLMLYVVDEYNTDKFHQNYDQIYHVGMTYYVNDQPMFSFPPPAGLQNDWQTLGGVISGSRAFNHGSAIVEFGQAKFSEKGILFIDSAWLEVFDFEFANNNFGFVSDPSKIAISSIMAEKYFNNEDPIGKVIQVDKHEYQVVNVIQPSKFNSSIDFNFLISFSKRKDYGVDINSYSEGHTPYFIYGNKPMQEVRDNIQALIDSKLEGMTVKIDLTPFNEFYFSDKNNYQIQKGTVRGNQTYYNVFILIACLILIIAVINYINLVTSRASDRAKEVGIKKTIGANKTSLITQFLFESVLITFFSGIIAIALAELFLGYFNLLLVKPIGNGILISAGFLIIYSLSLAFLAILAGIYPAFILSTYKPISAIGASKVATGGSSWLRNVLITVQFTITTVLIFGSVVIMNQLSFLSNFNLGFDSDKILTIKASDYAQKHIDVIKPKLAAIKGVEYVSVGNLPGIGWMYSQQFGDESVNVAQYHVDDDFVNMAGLKLLEGRGLQEQDKGTNNIIVNRTLRDLIFKDQPTSFGEVPGKRDANLVGVVEDFQFISPKSKIMPLELKMHSNEFGSVLLRLNKSSNPKETVDAIESAWQKFDSEDVFEYSFLDEQYDNQFKSEMLFLMLVKYFAGLSVFIGCIGLFGLAQFAFIRKIKELGIRKILGASEGVIIQFMSRKLLLPIFIATLIGLPIGYYLMNLWIADYTNRIDIGWPFFTITIAVIVLVAFITIAYQIVNAVMLKPIDSLRDE